MLNKIKRLNPKIFDDDVEKKSIRDGFGEALIEIAEKDERIVALSADLSESVRLVKFKEKFPERYIEVGVAEQSLATVASGLANYGKIPFITSFAAFNPGRNWEQIRTTIALNNVPVKIIGSHAGIDVGPDGATHQMLEDIALARVIPNMTVLSPCDFEEAKKATFAIAQNDKPTYMRFGRSKAPIITTKETPFEIRKADVLWESENPKVLIIATGALVYNALVSAKELEDEGIGVVVINLHAIKPLDEKIIVEYAKKIGAIVTIEDHQIAGGMGSAVAELLARECPTRIEFLGIKDKFGQSGESDELTKHYELDVESIKKAVVKVIKRKQ